MLSDADIAALCAYTVAQMAKLLEDKYLHWMAHKFVQLCDLAVGWIIYSVPDEGWTGSADDS